MTLGKYRIIDLFAGIGGIRLGFEAHGCETVFSSEWDKATQDTYEANFGERPFGDITKIAPQDIPDHDILLAGFPCQPFSIAGNGLGFADTRGTLFFTIEAILYAKKPKAFFLENVKNLKTHNNGNTLKVILETLEKKLGYFVQLKVLNTMEYGNIPQNRERIYIVGFSDKKAHDKFSFPEKMKLTKTIHDCLEQKEVDSKYYYNDKPFYDLLKKDITKKDTVYQWRRKYVRENKNNVCPTLTANMGMGGHNVPLVLSENGIRKLTPRECANFQGFPESYKLPNIADSHLYKQLGNSVSVPVVQRIAENIIKALTK